jgi:hypothetical protein
LERQLVAARSRFPSDIAERATQLPAWVTEEVEARFPAPERREVLEWLAAACSSDPSDSNGVLEIILSHCGRLRASILSFCLSAFQDWRNVVMDGVVDINKPFDDLLHDLRDLGCLTRTDCHKLTLIRPANQSQRAEKTIRYFIRNRRTFPREYLSKFERIIGGAIAFRLVDFDAFSSLAIDNWQRRPWWKFW